jgi:predicted aldo/keto reductase-like oxidoreductase
VKPSNCRAPQPEQAVGRNLEAFGCAFPWLTRVRRSVTNEGEAAISGIAEPRYSRNPPEEDVMDRRNFLRKGTAAAAGLTASSEMLTPVAEAGETGETPANLIPRRQLGNTGEKLSIVGFGGIVVMDNSPSFASNIVAEAVDRGINYFDIAPSYGDAQARLGPALEPYRKKVFLACKEEDWTQDGCAKLLEESLRLLRTDHLDLYQFHALSKMQDLEKIFGPKGAMETFEAAKKEGKIRFIGFSAHSVEVALSAMDRYNFNTILFPVNFVLFSQANFGPQVIKKAQSKGMGIMALKGMAKTTWPGPEKQDHPHPKCWYEPAAFPHEAALGLRWTLSQPITAAIPPGDERYFRLGMDVAQRFEPVTSHEKQILMARAAGVSPIFHLGTA